LLVLLALFMRPSFGSASDSDGVFINEIMWAGSSTSAVDKWIELVNLSDHIIDLSGWSLYRNKRDDNKNQDVLMLTIQNGLIAPGGYFLIGHNDKDHQFKDGKSVLNVDPDVVSSSVNWDKSHFKISLRNSSNTDTDIDWVGDKTAFFKKYEQDVGSVQRVDYSNHGDLPESWKACLRKEDFDNRTDPEKDRKYIVADPKDLLDEGVTDCATPENSGRPKIDKLDFDKLSFAKGTKINLNLNYEVSDSHDDLDTIQVALVADGKTLQKNEGEYGQKRFFFGTFSICPTVEVTFFDKTGLWAKQKNDLICYEKSNNIKFYEILPHPKNVDWNKDGMINSSDEWIELVNFGDKDIQLDGWKIVDASGKTFQIASDKIPAQDFKAFYKNQTNISLNDSGEKLFLYDPEDKLIDSIDIPSSSSKYDMSYAKWGDSWFWTTNPTPNAVNMINQPKTKNNPDYGYLAEAEGKTVALTSEVSEVERTSFSISVDSKPVRVAIGGDLALPRAGDTITLRGISHSGSNPYIVATSFKITRNTSSPQNNLEDLLSNEATINAEETTKTIKTKKTVSKKISSSALSPMVLGSTSKRSPESFNIISFLLYSSGVLSFLLTILIYDFFHRK